MISIFRIAETGVVAVVLALASAATVHFFKNIHPLVILGAGALIFVIVAP